MTTTGAVRAGRGAGLVDAGAGEVAGGVVGRVLVAVGVGRGWSARAGVVTGVAGADVVVRLCVGRTLGTVGRAGAAAPELQATAANRIAAAPPIAATRRRGVTAPRYRAGSKLPG